MENTQFEVIYHLFLNSIQDYSIKKLFKEDIETADDLLETMLIKAIPEFYNCKKDIKNIDLEKKCFYCCLDIDEINILVKWMIISWVTYIINDITQMNLGLNDSDFKHFSEERNLREKNEYYNRLREIVTQNMINYSFDKIPFKEWAVGNYEI